MWLLLLTDSTTQNTRTNLLSHHRQQPKAPKQWNKQPEKLLHEENQQNQHTSTETKRDAPSCAAEGGRERERTNNRQMFFPNLIKWIYIYDQGPS
jgi:hypothetical protein